MYEEPSRFEIFREIEHLLEEAKNIQEARNKYHALVLALVLGKRDGL